MKRDKVSATNENIRGLKCWLSLDEWKMYMTGIWSIETSNLTISLLDAPTPSTPTLYSWLITAWQSSTGTQKPRCISLTASVKVCQGPRDTWVSIHIWAGVIYIFIWRSGRGTDCWWSFFSFIFYTRQNQNSQGGTIWSLWDTYSCTFYAGHYHGKDWKRQQISKNTRRSATRNRRRVSRIYATDFLVRKEWQGESSLF